MNIREKLLKREKECFDFLNAIPTQTKYVLIGGYAVSSYGFPRFSVDLDLVIPQKEINIFEKILKNQSFTLTKEKKDLDLDYSGEFKRYVKKTQLPVSVDLLINSVKSRQTDTSYSFKHLLDNSEDRTVNGWNPHSKSKVKAADREMLIALKINSMRLTDKRDTIILCYKKPNTKKIAEHLKRCPQDIIKNHLEELQSLIENPKYTNSIKGEFSINDQTFQKATKNTQKLLKELQKLETQ